MRTILRTRSVAKWSPAEHFSTIIWPFAGLYFCAATLFQARTVGGFIDSWNADDNLSFSGTAMMRYRSRRDIAELVMDPMFSDGHIYKLAAIERTVSYPPKSS